MRFKSIFIIFSVLLIGLQAIAADLSIKAYVDRNVVSVNQQFTLSLEYSGKQAKAAGNPALPTIAFARYIGSSSSQNIQFINGAMTVSKTIQYQYVATKIGKFKIDPILVKHKGTTYRTQPIQIEVRKVAASQQSGKSGTQRGQSNVTDANAEDLYLKALVNKRTVYPNEPVVVTYKLYTRVNVSNLSLVQAPTTSGFWTEEIDMGGRVKQSKEVINGLQYTVAEIKKTILFPTGAGDKMIEPMELLCDVQVSRSRSRSRDPFDDFFNDPFFFGRTEKRRVKSPAVHIKVLPFPAENRPANFSGLTGRFRMEGKVNKTRLKTNEAVTYTITVSGVGNINSIPQLDPKFSSDFEVYKPKISQSVDRTGNQVSGKKVFEYVLVPRVPGSQKIRPVELAYFDVSGKSYKILKTAPVLLEIEKGDEIVSSAPTGLTKEEVRYFGQDIRFIKTESLKFNPVGSSVYQKPVWLILLLPLAGLFWAIGYRKHLDRLETDVGYARNRRATHAAKKGLAKARGLLKSGNADQFYAETARALRQFLADKLNMAEAGMMSDEVRAQLLAKGVQEEAIIDYFKCLDAADMKRFSPSAADIDEMQSYLNQAEMVLSTMDRMIV